MIVPAIHKMPILIANQMSDEERDMVLLQGLCGGPSGQPLEQEERSTVFAGDASATVARTSAPSKFALRKGL